MQPSTTLRETCLIANGTGDLACKLIQIIVIAVIFCGRMVQSKNNGVLSRSACTMQVRRFCAANVCLVRTIGVRHTNTNKFSDARHHRAWFYHKNTVSLPRSRLAEHAEHPAHFGHWHFFSQLFGLVKHHGLHSPAAWELVVVVGVVSVVVTGSSPPSHEQQGSPVMSFVHLWHSKDPPCATHALMRVSISHVGSDDVDGAKVVVVGTVDELVLGGSGQSVHWHLFSY